MPPEDTIEPPSQPSIPCVDGIRAADGNNYKACLETITFSNGQSRIVFSAKMQGYDPITLSIREEDLALAKQIGDKLKTHNENLDPTEKQAMTGWVQKAIEVAKAR